MTAIPLSAPIFAFMVRQSKFTILLVDDQPEVLRELVSIFEDHFAGARVLQTILPRKAVEIARAAQPDVLFTDWDMPEMNGLELMQAMQDDPATAGISTILCSGKNITSRDLYKALNAGAVDYLRKPFDHAELVARVTTALRERDRLRMIEQQREEIRQEKERNEALLQQTIDFQKLDIEALALKLQTNREVTEAIVEKLDGLDKYGAVARLSRDLKLQLQAGERLQTLTANVEIINAEFERKLHERFPSLTPGDIELCGYYRIGLTSKEISLMTNKVTNTIKKHRQRVRAKLGIEPEENIVLFLKALA